MANKKNIQDKLIIAYVQDKSDDYINGLIESSGFSKKELLEDIVSTRLFYIDLINGGLNKPVLLRIAKTNLVDFANLSGEFRRNFVHMGAVEGCKDSQFLDEMFSFGAYKTSTKANQKIFDCDHSQEYAVAILKAMPEWYDESHELPKKDPARQLVLCERLRRANELKQKESAEKKAPETQPPANNNAPVEQGSTIEQDSAIERDAPVVAEMLVKKMFALMSKESKYDLIADCAPGEFNLLVRWCDSLKHLKK